MPLTGLDELATPMAELAEPGRSQRPAPAELAPATERLTRLLELAPAARPTGETAGFDPCQLSARPRIDCSPWVIR